MCVVIVENMRPSNTRLISMKLDDGSQTVIYLNKTDSKGVMVVPFPVDKGEIELINIKNKIGDLERYFKVSLEALYANRYLSGNGSFIMKNSSRGDEYDSDFHEVYKVGNYNISIADNIDNIKEKVDWSEFGGFTSFAESAIETCKNKTLYPPRKQGSWKYIIASASDKQETDGFGVNFHCSDIYIPLAHEEDDSKTLSNHYYDTSVISLGWRIDTSCRENLNTNENGDVLNHKKLPDISLTTINNSKIIDLPTSLNGPCSLAIYKSYMTNFNIIGNKTTTQIESNKNIRSMIKELENERMASMYGV